MNLANRRKIFDQAVAILCLVFLAGCATQTVKRVQPDYWTRHLAENALTTRHVSERTAAYLSLRGWEGKALRRPDPILLDLREQLLQRSDRNGLISFAEFAYLSGKRAKRDSGKAKYFMTAARAAYAVMFDKEMGPMLDPLDPNLRFAADLYNYSLSQLVDMFMAEKDSSIDKRHLELVEGTIAISKGHGDVDGSSFSNSLVAFSYNTDALRLHNRRRGIGVPVIAVRSPEVLIEGQGIFHPPVYQAGVNPVTLLVRFDQPWSESGDELTAETELWYSLATTHAEVEGTRVPLEADTSLSLSLMLDRGAEFRGLLNMTSLLRKKGVSDDRGLFLLSPYDPDKIPVVLTHGLMDSPLTWVPMLNSLMTDSVLSERYQFWLFFYPTMNPILQSGSELRHSLKVLYDSLKAEGNEWNDMVLVGHSMGGLLTRLQISSSAEYYRNLEKQGLEFAAGDEELQEYIKSILNFEPLPYVRRAVFIGTPHKGADMAHRPAGLFGISLIKRPEYMREFTDGKDHEKYPSRMANGIANLAPDSPFTLALTEGSWSSNVTVHSIIGDFWKAGRTNGTDTIVEYWSSHVEGAESELIVHANHLVIHKETAAISELRRILLEHLDK